MSNWKEEFNNKFDLYSKDETDQRKVYNGEWDWENDNVIEFIDHLRLQDRDELIKMLEEKKIGQNVILNCVSRGDLGNAKLFNIINEHIYLHQQLIQDYYNK